MNSRFFLASGDEQHEEYKVVLELTSDSEPGVINFCETSAFSARYLRCDALTKAQQGDYQKAIALLSQLIDRHPQNAVDYNNRGLVYFESGEIQKAICDYNRALKLNPNLASAYNNRANSYAASGKLADAIADYDRALDLNPSYVRAWINRGITWRELGQYSEAIDNFEVALVFEQLEIYILAQRGRTYHLWGDWNCAVADYRRVLNDLENTVEYSENSAYRLRLQVENWLDELLSPQQ